MISNIVNLLSFPTEHIPRILVVGIGYPLKGLEDWGARRHNDLTPTYVADRCSRWKDRLQSISGRKDLEVHSGGAPLFMDFIRQELIPFVEENYRVNSHDRALFGHSFGRLFSLCTLFHAPQTFQRYYAGSPSIWWDDEVILKHEADYARNNKDLPFRLFMGVGELESETMTSGIKRMADQLKSRNYPGFDLQTHIFEDETHVSTYPVGLCRALRVLYGQ